MHHCFPLVFICPAPPRIHTHTLVSSPAGRRTGGAVLVFIAMKGAECLFMIPVCVLQLFVPITHIEVNDYFKLLEAVVVWRELLKLFRVLCVSSKNLITKLRMRCGEREKYELAHEHAEFPTCQKRASHSHLDSLSREMYEWLYF